MTQEIYFSEKQSKQLNRMYNELQSYLPFKESTFCNLGGAVLGFVQSMVCYQDEYTREYHIEFFKSVLREYIGKHYMNGFRINKQRKFYFHSVIHPRMINPEYGYTPLETVAAIKALRAFRDFAYSGLKNEDELIERLIKISGLLS